MSFDKDEMLSCIEYYLRDKSKDGLYNTYDYIGDFLSVQDLVTAEQDSLYMDYLVVEIMSIIHDWSVARIKCMVIDLGIDLVSKGGSYEE